MMTLLGAPELNRTLERIARRIPGEAGAALVHEGKRIEQISRDRTPVLTGALRDSHTTSRMETSGREITVNVSAGDGVPYAIIVHEDIGASSGPKFLQAAALGSAGGMGRRLASRFNIEKLVR